MDLKKEEFSRKGSSKRITSFIDPYLLEAIKSVRDKDTSESDSYRNLLIYCEKTLSKNKLREITNIHKTRKKNKNL